MADRVWYFAVGGNRQGPISEDELRAKIASGEIRADTLVWNSGMADWAKAGAVPGLMAPGAPAMPPGAPALPHPRHLAERPGRRGVHAAFRHLAAVRPFAAGVHRRPADHSRAVGQHRLLSLVGPTISSRRTASGCTSKAQLGDIWWVFMLNAIFSYARPGAPALSDRELLASVFFYYVIIRWVFAKLALGRPDRAPAVCRQLSGACSAGCFPDLARFISIIGWAWVRPRCCAGSADNVEGSSEQLTFVATGWGCCGGRSCSSSPAMFIIPIPWTCAG